MATVIVESNLPMVAADLEAAAGSMALEAEMALGRASLEAKEIVVQLFRGMTPRRTGNLADSTVGDVSVVMPVATVIIRQTARTEGGFPYANWVIKGNAPGNDPNDPTRIISTRPGGLLRTPYGPRRSVKVSKPNPYPTRVMASAQIPVDAVLRKSGMNLVMEVVNVMKG